MRKDPALLLELEFFTSSVKPAGINGRIVHRRASCTTGVTVCTARAAPDRDNACSLGQGTITAFNTAAVASEKGNGLLT